MALPMSTWVVMLGSIAVLWGTAVWALVRSLRDEDEKLELLNEQSEIDTYSPRSMAELREWIRANPGNQHTEEGRARYNECVETLKRIDTTFYDWNQSEIDALEKL
jgi:ABC-type nickel/cobalt efflux system permease component RcnA